VGPYILMLIHPDLRLLIVTKRRIEEERERESEKERERETESGPLHLNAYPPRSQTAHSH
jgi:hypothetical protein